MRSDAPLLLLRQNHLTPDDIVRSLAMLQSIASMFEEALDTLVSIVGSQPIRAQPLIGDDPPTVPLDKKSRSELYGVMALNGVGSVQMWPLSRRRVYVSLDAAPPFWVTRSEAALLDALIGQEDFGDDGFLTFRPLSAIAARLGCSGHCLKMAISRLRNRLAVAARVSPLLIETRLHEVRFRLRRSRTVSPMMAATNAADVTTTAAAAPVRMRLLSGAQRRPRPTISTPITERPRSG